jgi:hypothetical protein
MIKDRLELAQIDKPWLNRLGLVAGHIERSKENQVLKNSSWFSRACEYKGTGDVSDYQVEKAAAKLEEGELVVMLPSHASTMWQADFMDNLFRRTEFNPGRRYIASRFGLLITPRCIYLPAHLADEDLGYAISPQLGELPTISQSRVYQLLKPARAR